MVTVFTPVYNREKYLMPLYNSLCKQTCKKFEWLVVDDGSSDNSVDVVNDIISKHHDSFRIRLFAKPNGGKHTAINLGVKKAQYELFMILDSDDSLPPNAIADVLEQAEDIKDDPEICGVCGLMAHHDGTLIGSRFHFDGLKASSIEQRYKYHIKGDLMEVFKTSILCLYPFPEIPGERFSPEALVWNRIALRYKLKCFNRIIYFRDYLMGGLTDNIVKIRMKSPIGSMMCYAELNKLDIPFVSKAKAAINYWRFRLCLHHKKQSIPSISCFWIWTFPIAFLMHIKDTKL